MGEAGRAGREGMGNSIGLQPGLTGTASKAQQVGAGRGRPSGAMKHVAATRTPAPATPPAAQRNRPGGLHCLHLFPVGG